MATRPFDSAFPVFDSEGCTLEDGLSKREYFAAMALQGISAGGQCIDCHAYFAVKAADELITELNKKNEKSNPEEQPQKEKGTEA